MKSILPHSNVIPHSLNDQVQSDDVTHEDWKLREEPIRFPWGMLHFDDASVYIISSETLQHASGTFSFSFPLPSISQKEDMCSNSSIYINLHPSGKITPEIFNYLVYIHPRKITLPSSRHYGFSIFSWWRTSSHWTLITCMVFGQQLLNSLDLGVGASSWAAPFLKSMPRGVDLPGDIWSIMGYTMIIPKIGSKKSGMWLCN